MDPFVAREWSAPATSSADVGWDRRSKPRRDRPPPRHQERVPVPQYPQHRRRLMPASLADQAAKVAAAHIQDIDPSHLQALSPRALQILLKHLDFESMSLSTWKALQELARAGHLNTNNKLDLYQFLHHIEVPTADLSVYLAPLQSHNFAFISHLRIAGTCLIKAEELLYLPRWANNLGLLELIEPSDDGAPFPRLSDRLFKAWSLHDVPFPKLKGIRLSTHSSITKHSLQYLTQFPALMMLDITSEKRTWAHPKSLANALGWIYCNWAEAETSVEDDDDDAIKGDIAPEASLTSLRNWMRLSLRIDALYVKPQDGMARENVGTTDAHGFKIYNWLELPSSKILQQAYITLDLPWSSALASLTLGRDRDLIRQRHYSHKRMFFWRYWQDEIRYPLPSEQKGKEVSQKLPSVTERRDKSGAAAIRSSKKRSAASISDVLSHFEGT